MPELPEVETLRRGLGSAMSGRRILAVEQRRPDLRFPLPQGFGERITGRRVERVDRRAKYLLARLSGDLVLIMHLGMSGRFVVEAGERRIAPGDFYFETPRDPAHDHVVFRLEDGTRIVYNDARRFGAMDLAEEAGLDTHPLLAHLGVEPLGEAFSPAFLARALSGRATSLKAALLDQRIVAGLGNIYVCEALHRAGLSPQRKAGSLAPEGRANAQTKRLVATIRSVLEDAIAAGGSTLRDYAQADGARGAFQEAFAVYDREHAPCPRAGCRGVVARIVQSGRSTFYCPQCQQ